MLEFRSKHGQDCAYCTLCATWKKESYIRKFMGKDVCTGCYLRFKKFIEGMEINKAVEWFLGRLNVETSIQHVGTGAMKIDIYVQKQA